MLDSEAFLWMDMSIAEDSCISKRGNSEEIMMQRVIEVCQLVSESDLMKVERRGQVVVEMQTGEGGVGGSARQLVGGKP